MWHLPVLSRKLAKFAKIHLSRVFMVRMQWRQHSLVLRTLIFLKSRSGLSSFSLMNQKYGQVSRRHTYYSCHCFIWLYHYVDLRACSQNLLLHTSHSPTTVARNVYCILLQFSCMYNVLFSLKSDDIILCVRFYPVFLCYWWQWQ